MSIDSEQDRAPGGDLLTASVDTLTDLVSSVPAPIRNNAFKALNQLVAAAISVPVAYLEGLSAEKRAESQARIKIIATEAAQIVAQMRVSPEFAQAAVEKYGQKIVREQVNLNRVSKVALEQLQIESLGTEDIGDVASAIPTIDDDWLNSFEKEARKKSTEEMQLLFGKILADEIRHPSSFSIKTVNLISQLDAQVAKMFRLLCSLSISLRNQSAVFDARVLSLGGTAASNSLQKYGLSFHQLNVLHEYGLIIADYNSWRDYGVCVASADSVVGLAFTYQNDDWGLKPTTQWPDGQELKLNGVALSGAGRELVKIVEVEPHEEYTAALDEFFWKKDLLRVRAIKAPVGS